MSNHAKKTSLLIHWQELRARLLKSFLAVLGGFVLSWFFSREILQFLRQPIAPFLKSTQGAFVFTAPLDNWLAHFHLSFFAGILLASPYWLNQLWRFMAPGLYEKEKKAFLSFWITGFILFLSGAGFAYFIVFPLVFQILIPFGGGVDYPLITIKSYLSFVTRFMLIFGLIFELPLLLAGLCYLGIMSSRTLRQYRKHAIVCMALLSAVATPPDVLSQLLLLIPLILLYEISVCLAWFFSQKTK